MCRFAEPSATAAIARHHLQRQQIRLDLRKEPAAAVQQVKQAKQVQQKLAMVEMEKLL